MALNSYFIQVTNTTAGEIYLADINQGFDRESAARVRRPGPVYVPALGTIELALSGSVMLSYDVGDIRQQINAGNLTASIVGGGVSVHTFMYDFATQGGSTGSYTLTDIQGNLKSLPSGLMLRGWLDIITAPVSAGTPTGTVGWGADTDGFVTLNSNIETGWTANLIVPFNNEAGVCNGLIDDTTIGNQLAFAQTKLSTPNGVVFILGGAALTAGKFLVHVEMLPILT